MFRTSPAHHQERFVQAVFADLASGNTCNPRHVQPLLRNGWTCRVVRTIVPHTKVCDTDCKNAPDDGPVRSEICRANLSAEKNLLIKTLCVSCWTTYMLQDDTRSLQYQV